MLKNGFDNMKKSVLEGYLQTIVPKNIKICESVTRDELINGLRNVLLEEQLNDANENSVSDNYNPMNNSTIVDMYGSAPTFSRPYKDVKGNIQTTKMKGLVNPNAKTPNGGGFEKSRKGGVGAIYSQRLGLPAIKFEGDYNNLSDNELKSLHKLFTPEQVEYIYDAPNSSWQEASVKPLYVVENQLKTGRGTKDKVRVFFDNEGLYFKDVPYGWLNSLYTRNDEGRRTKQYKTGNTMVEMRPADNYAYSLPLDDRTAFLLSIPGEDGLFLISMSSQEGNAFFEV